MARIDGLGKTVLSATDPFARALTAAANEFPSSRPSFAFIGTTAYRLIRGP